MSQPVRLDRIASTADADSGRPSMIAPCVLLALLSGCAGLALLMMYEGAWFVG